MVLRSVTKTQEMTNRFNTDSSCYVGHTMLALDFFKGYLSILDRRQVTRLADYLHYSSTKPWDSRLTQTQLIVY